MRRVVLLAIVTLGLAACGAEPPTVGRAGGAAPPPLVEGEGLYRLRLNRPRCQWAMADLAYEVETPLGWERVSAEDAEPEDDEDLLGSLARAFEPDARAVTSVRAVLGPELRAYGDHFARVLKVQAVGESTESP